MILSDRGGLWETSPLKSSQSRREERVSWHRVCEFIIIIIMAEVCVGNSVQCRLLGNNINLYRCAAGAGGVTAVCRWRVCGSCWRLRCSS